MALIFTKTTKNTCYEVRSAGNSIRLYSNGVFHSQWNARHILSGNLWDLLLLPLMFLERPESLNQACQFFRSRPLKALVLGVGGGAVINQIRAVAPQSQVTGVDLDSTHLAIARRYFGLKQTRVKLEKANAIDWVHVALQKPLRFDFLVEDIFCESADKPGEAERAIECTTDWLRSLLSLLKDNGILVMNFESAQQFGKARSLARNAQLASEVYCLQRPGYYNHVGVFCKKAVVKGGSKKQLMAQIQNLGLVKSAHATKIENFTLRRTRLVSGSPGK